MFTGKKQNCLPKYLGLFIQSLHEKKCKIQGIHAIHIDTHLFCDIVLAHLISENRSLHHPANLHVRFFNLEPNIHVCQE